MKGSDNTSDDSVDLPDEFNDANPELVLTCFSATLNRNNVERIEALRILSIEFARNGVNIYRVWRDNPDLAAAILGVDNDIQPSESLIAKYDRLVEMEDASREG